jgi:RHS repeat-associated protein
VLVELNNANAVSTSYVYGNATLLSQRKNGVRNYLLPDVQGSTRLLINNSATTQQTYDYRAFGDMVTTPSPLQTRYLYTAQQFDSASGNYSLRARTYNPTNGRFLTQDTYPYNFQNPVEINRYVYGINNPVRYMDASGMSITSDYGKLGAFALSVGGILSRIPPQTKNWLGDLYWGIGRLLTPEQWKLLRDALLGLINADHLTLALSYPLPYREAKEKEEEKTEEKKLQKHISLGLQKDDRLIKFTINLNLEWQGRAIVSMFFPLVDPGNRLVVPGWKGAGLTDFEGVKNFDSIFDDIAKNADLFHFNLEGIRGDYLDFARGGAEKFSQAPYGSITKTELRFVISRPEVCAKTLFYENGSIFPPIPNLALNAKLCAGI